VNPIWIVVLVLAIVTLIVIVAWVLYKLGFRLDKLKAKLGIVEIETSRTASKTASNIQESGTNVTQKASEGAEIIRSGISAPADSSAKVAQQAQGEKSKIEDSPIKLT